MKKLNLKHKKFDGCCLGKYKIHSITTYTDTDTEFDINIEDTDENIYIIRSHFPSTTIENLMMNFIHINGEEIVQC